MLIKNRATLRHHLESRPLCLKRDKTSVLCAKVGASLQAACPEAHKPGPHPNPESEALEFYFTNHVVGLIRSRRAMDEVLSTAEVELLDAYHEINNKNLLNVYHYVLLIIHREMRHFSGSTAGLATDDTKDFIKKLRTDGGETSASRRLGKYPPDATIGDLVLSISRCYNKGKWSSSSYGGPKWGNIADCLYQFVSGTYTGEMFLDTVWTLAHNGGPIFNKGMVYKNYGSRLLQILNVQAAGRIPQMINEAGKFGIEEYLTPDLLAFRKKAVALFDEALAGDVGSISGVGYVQKNHGVSEIPPNSYVVPGLIVTEKKEVTR